MSTNIFKLFLRNTSLTTRVWGGLEYSPNLSYSLEDVDNIKLIQDPDFISDLESGIAILSDDMSDLTIRIAKAALNKNVVILQEYYILTDEEDILVGNGQILHFHDDLWELDEEEQEDFPVG